MTEGGRPKIELAVFDVDGTIIANHGPPTVGRAIVDAFQVAKDAGVAVTLATGRTLDYVRAHLTEPLGLRTPVVTAQGAVIGDPVTGRVLAQTTIPRPVAQRALKRLDGLDNLVVLYLLAGNGATRMIERGDPAGPEHDDLFGVPRERSSTLASAASGAAGEPLKIIVEAPIEPGRDAVAELAALVGDELQVARTHHRLVELTAPGVDKGRGLGDLCAILGVGLDRVLAVGDNDNDVPMLRAAGVAVALADGSDSARAAADWIAPAFAADGAATALRRFIADIDP